MTETEAITEPAGLASTHRNTTSGASSKLPRLMPCASLSLKDREISYLESSKAQGRDLGRRATVLVKMGRATLLSLPCSLGANKADPQMQHAWFGRLAGS